MLGRGPTLVFAVALAACAAEEEPLRAPDAVVTPASPPKATDPTTPAPKAPAPPKPSPNDPEPDPSAPLTFPIPKKGTHVDLAASASLACKLLVPSRSFDFPADAKEPVVSITGKTMCFHDATFVHCHTSGTGTGLCDDTFDNVKHALTHPATTDGDFVIAYVGAHRSLRANVSGHSQGAYDASRIAPLLRAGDQLSLLQTPSAALVPNEPLLDALAKNARVYVVWSPNDNASLGIRLTAGEVPLIELPYQDIERVHNAPNARDQMLKWFHVAEGRTVSPALDASILSNPGSPLGPWRFPAWKP